MSSNTDRVTNYLLSSYYNFQKGVDNINQKLSGSEKQAIIDRYLAGDESVSTISIQTGIPRITLYAWIKRYCEKQESDKGG